MNKEDVLFYVFIIIVILALYLNIIRMTIISSDNDIKCEIKASEDIIELSELAILSEEITIHETEICPVAEPMTEDELAEEEYYDSLEMLAICVEAEAGNQDLLGKRLVADVILNRVDSERFPDDIVSVISDKNQFSTYTDGAMDRVWEPSEETFLAVQMELENRTDSDILFFTAGSYNPYCTPAYKHGNHYFGY